MGLQYGYDEIKCKWYAKGFQFLRYYETKEEMEADKYDALISYFDKLKSFHDFAMSFTQLRYMK